MEDQNSLSNVEKWMTHFYEHPRKEFVPTALKALDKLGTFGEVHLVDQIIIFFALVFQKYPDYVENWILPLYQECSKDGGKAILTSVWLSDIPNTKKILDHLSADSFGYRTDIEKLEKGPVPMINQIVADSPKALDMLWAAFFATGDEGYVVKIIDAIGIAGLSEKAKLISGNAEWSLRSNAAKHELIKRICQRQIQLQNPAVSEVLKEIVRS